MTYKPSARAEILTRRTYNRPKDADGIVFETWEETVDRVISHQRWLWERAKGQVLSKEDDAELAVLRNLMLERKVLTSGRTLWLGGTDVSRTRESSMFNCSFGRVETVHDVVDALWLLLQGCGVGFDPVPGILNGFTKSVQVRVIRSTKTNKNDKGYEHNREHLYYQDGLRVWELVIGDSAEAWAKAAGKLMAMKHNVDVVVLNFREIRPAGVRLRGYGWISSGDEQIAYAFYRICLILSKKAGTLLNRIDILDIMNLLGTVLSSRRSAEIAVMEVSAAEIDDFIVAKRNFWEYKNDAGEVRYAGDFESEADANSKGFFSNDHRQQSNNSILFYSKPTKWELGYIFQKIKEAGGSEPGFINAEAARKRAPWFKGVNPCAEILLGNKSFCNLVEVDVGKFNDDFKGLQYAMKIAARANYRQTCVNLDDGILQRSWHELNEFLRLCGVGITGIVRWKRHTSAEHLQAIREAATIGANSMADELGLPRPKLVTTVKPSGTLGKIMDTTEGVHKPLGKYVFNNVKFSKYDPLVDILREAGYNVFEVSGIKDAVLVTLPASYEDVEFDVGEDGVERNTESAVSQLERYKLLMQHYVDHNCSITISYDESEVPAIIDWLLENWDTYVGVSFIYRNDTTKTAEDLGYLYLPQEIVTKERYYAYVNNLRDIDLDAGNTLIELEQEACATGACPIR